MKNLLQGPKQKYPLTLSYRRLEYKSKEKIVFFLRVISTDNEVFGGFAWLEAPLTAGRAQSRVLSEALLTRDGCPDFLSESFQK